LRVAFASLQARGVLGVVLGLGGLLILLPSALLVALMATRHVQIGQAGALVLGIRAVVGVALVGAALRLTRR
jgi:hypothetical protein